MNTSAKDFLAVVDLFQKEHKKVYLRKKQSLSLTFSLSRPAVNTVPDAKSAKPATLLPFASSAKEFFSPRKRPNCGFSSTKLIY